MPVHPRDDVVLGREHRPRHLGVAPLVVEESGVAQVERQGSRRHRGQRQRQVANERPRVPSSPAATRASFGDRMGKSQSSPLRASTSTASIRAILRAHPTVPSEPDDRRAAPPSSVAALGDRRALRRGPARTPALADRARSDRRASERARRPRPAHPDPVRRDGVPRHARLALHAAGGRAAQGADGAPVLHPRRRRVDQQRAPGSRRRRRGREGVAARHLRRVQLERGRFPGDHQGGADGDAGALRRHRHRGIVHPARPAGGGRRVAGGPARDLRRLRQGARPPPAPRTGAGRVAALEPLRPARRDRDPAARPGGGGRRAPRPLLRAREQRLLALGDLAHGRAGCSASPRSCSSWPSSGARCRSSTRC